MLLYSFTTFLPFNLSWIDFHGNTCKFTFLKKCIKFFWMDTLYKLFSAEDYLDGCHISVWRIEMDIFMALWVYMMKFPEVLGQEHLIF